MKKYSLIAAHFVQYENQLPYYFNDRYQCAFENKLMLIQRFYIIENICFHPFPNHYRRGKNENTCQS